MSLNKVEEHLIIADWNFKSSENKIKGRSGTGIFDYETVTYNSKTYELIDEIGRITSLKVIDYANKKYNTIRIISDRSLFYRNILLELKYSGFQLSNKESQYTILGFGDNTKVGGKTNLEANGKVYLRGNHKIHLIIYKYAYIEEVDETKGTYTYDKNKVFDKFEIIVE
jgi:hypothetical protein